MKRKPDSSQFPKDLRARAEARLVGTRAAAAQMPEEDVRELLHNLQVHEVELEMQNDELRRSKTELEAAGERFSNLYDFAPCPLLTVGPGGEVLEANLAASALLGVERATFLRQKIAWFIPAEARDAFDLYCRQVVRSGDRPAAEFKFRSADGRQLTLLVKGTAIVDPATSKTHCRYSLTDITEIQLADDKVRQLSTAVEQSPVSVMITNAAGEIEYANPRFTALTGYTPAEVLGWNSRFQQSGHTSPETYRELWKTITAGKIWRGLFLNKKKNGELYWEDASISPIQDSAGRITHFLAVKEDITGRLQTEAALRESEANFRAFFESGMDVVIVATLGGQIVCGNAAATSTLGYSAQELAAMRLLDLHPASARLAAEELFAAVVRGERNSCSLPLACRDGRQVPVETRVWLGRWNGADCLFCASRDLTTEREAQQRFETLFRHSPAPMSLAVLPERRISDVNDAFLRLSGYSRAEILGKTAVELGLFVHPEQRAAVVDQLRAAERITNFEIQTRHKDGKLLNIIFSAEMIYSQGRQYALGVAIDITEHRAAELKLRESEALQRAITESAQDAVLMMDPEGRISHWNPAAERIFGYPSAEAIGQDLHLLLAPLRYHEPHQAAFPGFLRSGQGAAVGKTLDLEARRKDGQEISIQLALSAVCIGGGWHGVGIVRDITIAKQAEEELRKSNQSLAEATVRANALAEQASAANRAKSDFLAMMSHEIRTPMTAIIGMNNLLLNTPLDPRQAEFARTVATSGEALLEIINEILDFSKIEAGEHFQLDAEVFRLGALVDGLVCLLQPRAKARGLTLTAELADGIPDYLKSDSGRLRQVLMNLAGNAIKFTDHGGVKIRVQCLGCEARPVRLRFEVADTGIGISAEDEARLFQAFTQADSSASRRRGGTGLGLAISRRIVELLRGRIGVDSVHGQGSLFWFELDLEVAQPPLAGDSNTSDEPPIVGNRGRQGHPLHILVAEDHEPNRRLAKLMLESLEQRADFAGNGLEAVEAWERSDYDVILMDCQMPGMDGFEATGEIRRREAARTQGGARRVRIIALTANAVKGDRERCLAAGMDSYLSKPYTMEQLGEALGHHPARPGQAPPAPAGPTPPAAAGFDPQRPAQLCAELGEEGVLEIIGSFLQDLPQRVTEMETLAAAGHLAELARLAHSLRGIGRMLGLDGFSAELLTLEQAATAGDSGSVEQVMRRLPDGAKQSIAALEQWLASRRVKRECRMQNAE